MDGVIVVAKPGSTKLSSLQQTLVQLRSVGARVLGVVLNDVNPKSRKYGYYYNRYYSKYSYQYQKPAGELKNVKKPDKVFQTEPDKTFQTETDGLLNPDANNLYQSEPDQMLPKLKIKN